LKEDLQAQSITAIRELTENKAPNNEDLGENCSFRWKVVNAFVLLKANFHVISDFQGGIFDIGQSRAFPGSFSLNPVLVNQVLPSRTSEP
jgi:hypothetical protein